MQRFLFLFIILFSSSVYAQDNATMASGITIVRDNWGVPHIYGKTDQHCAFGMMYAQCEDNFWQLEETMIRQLGRAAEVYGEDELNYDAAVALYESVKNAKTAYAAADPLVRSLCVAAAAGINFYISSNPSVQPRLLKEYEPWFFLLAEPPSGRSIRRNERPAEGDDWDSWMNNQTSGSNALAISSPKTKRDRSILVINPHINFFGIGQRYEAHLISEEGLNASGFAIFGTFYIWSGFNDKIAWAHTNTGSDFADTYIEQPDPADSTRYKYNNGYRELVTWQDTIAYRSGEQMAHRVFTFQKTHHGPVAAVRDSFLLVNRSALDDPAGYILQSFRMAKAKTLEQFTSAMSLCTLTTNTMYADAKGNIAYWHGNRVPVRDTSFNWQSPVDGSLLQTEWKGYHKLDEIVHFVNPSSNYLQNCNSTPSLAAGAGIDPPPYPSYMGYDEQTLRAQEMLLQLSLKNRFAVGDVAKAITSKNLPAMRNWLSQIIDDYKKTAALQPEIKTLLTPVIDTLSAWNYQYDLHSTATTLAFAWHTEYLTWLRSLAIGRAIQTEYNISPILPTPPGVSTQLLITAVKDLIRLYGTPFVQWQEVCRLQRVHTSGQEKFDDNKPSIPVNAAPGIMGSLFAYNLRFANGAKRGYGVSGNTYVAIVAFGKKMRARSVVTFGQNSDPLSKHYFDQAPLYAKGDFKDAWYYKRDVMKHAEAVYQPGKRLFTP